ncbi:MAG: Asp-tRNA(Asn)/Glu-tRNA(Gln) amidotransferase subunit GatB [Anaerolineales bacterium]|nr:Asp-tRNA(Asn)/Glu-tRNA(Gln) amidotransferase subunit GatB [Anaerolineales bacterium]
MPEFESVIGLETHIQLNTQTKIFCGCKADSWEDLPNTNICPVCTGLPGVLPTLNNAVVTKAVLLALAVQVDSVQPKSYFARKNYFYPDLPKGYQISQYDEPLALGGFIDLPLPDGSVRRVTIEKLHLEEDAGKTVRQVGERWIDFNRCGVPLLEMVTGPDLRTADEAAQYLIRLRQLLRWLGISDADMERGQLRCDANVSIRPVGSDDLNTKTEIKNVNSIENVRSAIEAEIKRQIREVQSGGRIEAWTLDWDEDKSTLHKMRSKESEADYRYFREPDLLPVLIDQDWLEQMRDALPELPLERKERFIETYALPEYDSEILTEERTLSEYFERTVQAFIGDPKVVSNWMMNDLLRLIRERGTTAGKLIIQPEHLAELIAMVEAKTITASTGKELLDKVEHSGLTPEAIVKAEGLGQVSDEGKLRSLAVEIIETNPDQVATYTGGKTTILGWFVGQMMKETRGKANAQLVQKIFRELLEKS